MMAFGAQRFGRVDIVVNNAGIQHVASVEDFPVEKWDAILAINLSSAFHTTRLALPAMQQANWGRIINVASVHGLVGSAQNRPYVAAKHGIVGLTKVTALENATTGVTCNAICPGWVLTPLVQKQVDAKSGGAKHQHRSCHQTAAGRKRTFHAIHHPPRAGRVGGVLLLCCRQQCARRGMEHGRRLGCTINHWRHRSKKPLKISEAFLASSAMPASASALSFYCKLHGARDIHRHLLFTRLDGHGVGHFHFGRGSHRHIARAAGMRGA